MQEGTVTAEANNEVDFVIEIVLVLAYGRLNDADRVAVELL